MQFYHATNSLTEALSLFLKLKVGYPRKNNALINNTSVFMVLSRVVRLWLHFGTLFYMTTKQ